MRNGNVIEYLQRHPDTNRLTAVWQIMKGLEYLHTFDPSIAHRAIKGTNILVNDDFTCCLSDFGLSSIPELSQQSRDYAIGSIAWMAPEILHPPEIGRVDQLKVDIFALAITILEMYLGGPPLKDVSFATSYIARVTDKEKLPIPPPSPYEFPRFLCELVKMMVTHDPGKRPTARLVCQGLEDNLVFPRRFHIRANETGSSTAEGQASYTNENPAGETVQQWITVEREQMRNFKHRLSEFRHSSITPGNAQYHPNSPFEPYLSDA
ncbi:Serine/threonine-protein kinase pakG [Leucoagaricus sp. SymC.cos]|nr:Serine/threonine-protein kinase pakG [Leucoagaricus sp. SymC.cos]